MQMKVAVDVHQMYVTIRFSYWPATGYSGVRHGEFVIHVPISAATNVLSCRPRLCKHGVIVELVRAVPGKLPSEVPAGEADAMPATSASPLKKVA